VARDDANALVVHGLEQEAVGELSVRHGIPLSELTSRAGSRSWRTRSWCSRARQAGSEAVTAVLRSGLAKL